MIGHAVTVILRALVPIFGVVFLNWSAPTLLVVYFADTAAEYYVLLAFMVLASERDTAGSPSTGEAIRRRLRRQIRAVLVPIPTLALVGGCFGILPLFVMLDLQGLWWADFVANRNMWVGVGLQFALALSLILERSYRTPAFSQPATDIRVHGAPLVVRWLVMIAIGFFLAPGIPSIVYGPVLIAAYSLMTAALEIAPYQVLDWARRVAGGVPVERKGGKRRS